MKRCYIRCARIHPENRKCRFCRNSCALRMTKFVDFEVPLFADNHEDKAITMMNEDQKELVEQNAQLTGKEIQ